MARVLSTLACVIVLAACQPSLRSAPAQREAAGGAIVADATPTDELHVLPAARPQRPPTDADADTDTGSTALSAADPAQVQAAPAAAAARTWQTGGPTPPGQRVELPFLATEIARFNQPWAMTFLPDGRLLVTQKTGQLRLLDVSSRELGEIAGVPAVAYGGQGGLGDVVLHPQFASNGLVYLSFVEAGANDTRGAAIVRAKLLLDGTGGSLTQMHLIWRQVPKVTGLGHFSHRLAFDSRGKLWVSSGDRQKFTPAQDMKTNLGKILRLNGDGSPAADNPFAGSGGVAAQVWSLGHRNPLGLAFDANGRLWSHEMGPRGGDELNLIERGSNYGWPIVSNGDHYDTTPIPDHHTRPEFNAPETWWTPVIAPSGFVIYSGNRFPQFRGHGFIGGLVSQALIRIEFNGTQAMEAERYAMGRRIREVEQGPDGALWVLEDGVDARLLKLTEKP